MRKQGETDGTRWTQEWGTGINGKGRLWDIQEEKPLEVKRALSNLMPGSSYRFQTWKVLKLFHEINHLEGESSMTQQDETT